METVIAITLPIFLVIGLGFGTTKAGLFSTADMRIFGRFVISIALPALLFTALATRDLADIFDAGFMGFYSAASLLVLLFGLLWFHKLQGMPLDRAGVCIMGAACSNSGYMSFPILLLAFPTLAPKVLAMALMVENLLMIPVALTLIAMGRRQGGGPGQMIRGILFDLIRRPLILALLAGLAWSTLQLPLPEVVERALAMISSASVALALFVIGGSLAGIALRGNVALAAQICFGKLLLHPLMALLLLALATALGGPVLEADLRACLLIACAVPMLGVYPIFAQEVGLEGLASLALLVTTAMSFFSLSLALALLL